MRLRSKDSEDYECDWGVLGSECGLAVWPCSVALQCGLAFSGDIGPMRIAPTIREYPGHESLMIVSDADIERNGG
jgi:hypothetical protein